MYAVSVAVVIDGVPEAGVVACPSTGERWWATRGGGARKNGRTVRVSSPPDLRTALVGTGFPFKEVGHIDDYLRMFRNITLGCSGVRRPGAAALDLSWVAAGRIDGFWEIGLSPWDMAAGALLVREAGGLVGDLSGEDGYLDSGRIVASNGKIFAAMLKALHANSAAPPA